MRNASHYKNPMTDAVEPESVSQLKFLNRDTIRVWSPNRVDWLEDGFREDFHNKQCWPLARMATIGEMVLHELM